MASNCWCNMKFHLPGEKKKHAEADKSARETMASIDAVEKRSGKVKKKNGSNS